MFLNSSRVGTWNLCKRKYYLEQEYKGTGLRLETPKDYFHVGLAVHEGLAWLYKGHAAEESVEHARQKYIEMAGAPWNSVCVEEWMEQANFVARMVGTYAQREEPKDDFTVLGVEQEFVVPLGEVCWNCGREYMFHVFQPTAPTFHCPSCNAPVHYWVGRSDLDIGRHGKVAILDHKTTSSTPSDDFLSSFANSFQLLGYVYGRGKSSGIHIDEFGVNALQKAATIGTTQSEFKRCPVCRAGKKKVLSCEHCGRTGQVEKQIKLEPFRRRFFSVVPSDIDRFVLTMHGHIIDIETHKKMDIDVAWPMNDKACKFGPCPFRDVCWNGPAKTWYEPAPELLEGLEPRPQDYVDLKQIILEEEG
jgi:hypothetical protein